MTYQEIKQLSDLLPTRHDLAKIRDNSVRSCVAGDGPSTLERRRFHLAYTCPSFGWEAAKILGECGRKKFPMAPTGAGMNWVYKAFLRNTLPDRLKHSHEFRVVADALMIFNQDGMTGAIRPIIESVLLTHPEKCAEVEDRMGLQPHTLEAYDALFYSVKDRKKDHMFLRQIVYPMTRLEEQMEEYLSVGNIGVQLRRMGYNKGMDSVMYFAGFRQDILGGLDANQASSLFKRAVMIQATLLAENGFLNFTRLHPAIISGKALVQSSMLGGQDQSEDGYNSTFMDLSAGTLGADSFSLQNKTREKAGLVPV